MPSRFRVSDRMMAPIVADGTAWLDEEWQARQSEARRRHADRRRQPLWMGWLLVGCGGLGVLLAAGLRFWVDTSGPAPPAANAPRARSGAGTHA